MRVGMGRFLDKALGGTVLTAPQVLHLIFPLLLDQVFVRVISIMSASMVADYGPEAMSAVSMVNALNFFITALFTAVATGCTVVVAQYFGRRDYKNAHLTVAQSLTSSTALSLVIAVSVLFFLNPIVNVLYGAGDALFVRHCTVFLAGNAISYPFFAVTQTVLGALRGAGNAKVSVYFATALNCLNIVLNIILLKIFSFGIVGLSISLIASRMVMAVIMFVYIFRTSREYPFGKDEFFRISKPIQRSVMMVASPIMLEAMFFNGGRLLTQTMLVGLGTMVTTANAYAMNLNMMLMTVGDAMMIAVVTIVGQCIGAGNTEEARRYAWRMILLGAVGCALASIITALTLPLFLGFFSLPPEAYAMSVKLSWLLIIFTPIMWPASFIAPNALRAAGDAMFTSVVALTLMWVIRVNLTYILCIRLNYGALGLWAIMVFEWAVRSVIFIFRLRGDKWYRHKVI